MDREILLKTDITQELMRVMALDKNKDSVNLFMEALDHIQASKCEVKHGWTQGVNVGFTLRFKHDENSTKKPFDLFTDGIEDKAVLFGFLMGLNADVFEYNPTYTLIDEKHTYLNLKIKRNEKETKM